MADVREDIGYMGRPVDDPPGFPVRSGPVPPCCKWGYSEEGFVHQWLEHFDQPTKDRVFKIADAEPWSRWLAAALAAEGSA